MSRRLRRVLIDVEQGIAIPGRTVLIDQGRIAAVAPEGAVDLPERTVHIDARGMFLMRALEVSSLRVLRTEPESGSSRARTTSCRGPICIGSW